MEIKLTVNGTIRSDEVEPRLLLIHYLRETLGLRAANVGCDTTSCGACTVLLDGEVVNSCLVAVGQCHQRAVITVEGLASRSRDGEVLHAVQRALVACGGAQCGICTPGIAVCAAHLVDRGLITQATDEASARAQIRQLLAGNICRCTGYQLIVEAVVAAVREVAT